MSIALAPSAGQESSVESPSASPSLMVARLYKRAPMMHSPDTSPNPLELGTIVPYTEGEMAEQFARKTRTHRGSKWYNRKYIYDFKNPEGLQGLVNHYQKKEDRVRQFAHEMSKKQPGLSDPGQLDIIKKKLVPIVRSKATYKQALDQTRALANAAGSSPGKGHVSDANASPLRRRALSQQEESTTAHESNGDQQKQLVEVPKFTSFVATTRLYKRAPMMRLGDPISQPHFDPSLVVPFTEEELKERFAKKLKTHGDAAANARDHAEKAESLAHADKWRSRWVIVHIKDPNGLQGLVHRYAGKEQDLMKKANEVRNRPVFRGNEDYVKIGEALMKAAKNKATYQQLLDRALAASSGPGQSSTGGRSGNQLERSKSQKSS